MKQKRQEWADGMAGPDASRPVFIDETWANTAMTQARGRCPEGERLVMPVPLRHRKTTTFVVALRVEGWTTSAATSGRG